MPPRLVAPVIALLIVLGIGIPARPGADPSMAKLSAELVALYEAYLAARQTGTPFRPTDPLLQLVDDRVVIDAVAAGETGVLRSDLIALGMRGAVAVGRMVSGQLPIAAIGGLAGLPSLRFARAAAATTHGGTRGVTP
jgi:hypothetical protein